MCIRAACAQKQAAYGKRVPREVGLTEQQTARVRAALARLLAEDAARNGQRGSVARVAQRLGVTGAAVSQLKAREDGKPSKHAPSLTTAAAIARELGMAPEQLLYERPPSGVLHRDLVGWALAEERALASPEEVVPNRAVRAAGGLPVMFTPSPLDPGYVVALATLWQDYSADATRADVAAAQATMAAEDEAAAKPAKTPARARKRGQKTSI